MLYKCNVRITVDHVGPTTIFRSHFIRFHIPTTWDEYTLVIFVSAHNSLNNSLTPLDTSAIILHRYNRYNKYNSYNNRNSLHRSPYNSPHNSLYNSLHNSLQLNSPVHNSPLRQPQQYLMQLNHRLSVWQNWRTSSIKFSVSYEKDTTKDSEARQ